MYICIHLSIYIYIYLKIRIHACMNIHTHVYTCMYADMYIYIYVHHVCGSPSFVLLCDGGMTWSGMGDHFGKGRVSEAICLVVWKLCLACSNSQICPRTHYVKE